MSNSSFGDLHDLQSVQGVHPEGSDVDTPAASVPAPERVPTLTEIVHLAEGGGPAPAGAAPATPTTTAEPAPVESVDVPIPLLEPVAEVVAEAAEPLSASSAAPLTEDQLVQRVLASVQHQLDLVLEVRLREALTPILTRAADAIVRDARRDLASTLQEVVTRAVAQELSQESLPESSRPHEPH